MHVHIHTYTNTHIHKIPSCMHSFVPLARAECNNSLLCSGASSIPLCYVFFPVTLLHQLFFHPLSPHLAIYFLLYPLILLFPNSYIIPFWEFYFLPFSVQASKIILNRTWFHAAPILYTQVHKPLTCMIFSGTFWNILKWISCRHWRCIKQSSPATARSYCTILSSFCK